MATQKTYSTAVIVGSGFSGIAIACQFKKQLNFHDFVIYEKSPALGGTWHLNTYPGCGVDVPAALYSLSFAPNPAFSRLFPAQSEILSYLKSVAKEYDIESHIQYSASWESARWQEETKTWILRLKATPTGELLEHECKVLISAVGRLVIPNPFVIPGQETFTGEIVHSARWRGDITLKDKNVVVVGNGCSGSQIVPAIAHEAKKVYHFMRTPQYYISKPFDHWRINTFWVLVFTYVPFILKLLRLLVFVYLESTLKEFYTEPSAEKSREKARKRSRDYVQKVAPMKYRSMLMPDYAIGCKRRILDPGYLQALHRENVDLTDDRIESLSGSDLVTKSGKRYSVDIVIVATGFKTFQYNMTVSGRSGKTLQSHWQNIGGIEAYKSTALADFPNFFLLSGPNSVGGHNSSVFSIETTIQLILKVIKPIIQGKAHTIEVKSAAEKTWSTKVQSALKERVYSDNCSTYYVDEKTGWNFTNYPWSFYHLWLDNVFPKMDDWQIDTSLFIASPSFDKFEGWKISNAKIDTCDKSE